MVMSAGFRLAEQAINDARRTRSNTLSLAGLELNELPESLYSLTWLTNLSLENNYLTTVPGPIENLQSLGSLSLGSNKFETVPDVVCNLKNLHCLDLSTNLIEALAPSLGKLIRLKELYLNTNRLISLPSTIGHLVRLKTLRLDDNELLEIPVELGNLIRLKVLDLSNNRLTRLPESCAKIFRLKELHLSKNCLQSLGEDWIGDLSHLEVLTLDENQITSLPASLLRLKKLRRIVVGSERGGNPLSELPTWLADLGLTTLKLSRCGIKELPEWFGDMSNLSALYLSGNELWDLPPSLAKLRHLHLLDLTENPLNPELSAAQLEGFEAVVRYLRAKADTLPLFEAKLILVGEGAVGKSCLLSALRDEPWENKSTTHGIEIKPLTVIHPSLDIDIQLNAWDFGGQGEYRPTHQLFFSAPAVYLVVWKPREGHKSDLVHEWIRLIKYRAPEARILIVATHGGPLQRQPDIDRQEVWDLFGREVVQEFFFVDSKPDPLTGVRTGISQLQGAIARTAATLPEMGRKVPARWKNIWETLRCSDAAYMTIEQVLQHCREQSLEDEEADIFLRISHRLGHLIHYEHDPALRNIVVLKPDWLATAISFVLNDGLTRKNMGLVRGDRLREIWNDPAQKEQHRYPEVLHPIFQKLMERFDISYRVVEGVDLGHQGDTSLVAQLVPDVRPDRISDWTGISAGGDLQRVQICRIVDAKSGQSASATGLFYQLIVRLHRFSLGRTDFNKNIHWRRGLVLDGGYDGRALLEHIGNDVRITVQAAYPERLLAVLTNDVKWLVESFWAGLRCDIMVPCQVPCGRDAPGTALYEVEKLIESRRAGRFEYPCTVCNNWQDIDGLLRNAQVAVKLPVEVLLAELYAVRGEVRKVRENQVSEVGVATERHINMLNRFDIVDSGSQRLLSRVDEAFAQMLSELTDEAKDGPRLFSMQPVEPGFLDRPTWVSGKFRLTLWCEHSRLPLTALNSPQDSSGVYELNLPRDWFIKAAPLLNLVAGTLSLVLPMASSIARLSLGDPSYQRIEAELDVCQKGAEAIIEGGSKVGKWIDGSLNDPHASKSGAHSRSARETSEAVEARGAALRHLHALLKDKDPGFGGLVRVQDKQRRFLWIHPKFEADF